MTDIAARLTDIPPQTRIRRGRLVDGQPRGVQLLDLLWLQAFVSDQVRHRRRRAVQPTGLRWPAIGVCEEAGEVVAVAAEPDRTPAATAGASS